MDTTPDNSDVANSYRKTGYDPLGRQNWGWSAINTDHMPSLEALNRNSRSNMISGTGSDADIASDIVDDNSSVSSGTRRGRFEEFETADDDGFEDPSPVPDMDEDQLASGVALQHEILEQREYAPIEQVLDDVAHAGHVGVEDLPAAEIHITESEDLKMD
jgi:ubiquitin carboxyl-terminal hydrolase 4/11/15